MQRRTALLSIGLLATGLMFANSPAWSSPAKESTVTLTISGMM